MDILKIKRKSKIIASVLIIQLKKWMENENFPHPK